MRLGRKLLDFISDDDETPPRLARTRRLNRGVERQQTRLARQILNHANNFADIVSLLSQRLKADKAIVTRRACRLADRHLLIDLGRDFRRRRIQCTGRMRNRFHRVRRAGGEIEHMLRLFARAGVDDR
jgi:hypothetical protein